MTVPYACVECGWWHVPHGAQWQCPRCGKINERRTDAEIAQGFAELLNRVETWLAREERRHADYIADLEEFLNRDKRLWLTR